MLILKKNMVWINFCVFIFLFLPFILGIKITEVELNPAGEDSGKEWIELYSEEKIELKDYKLINNDGDELKLESFGFVEGYKIITFEKQWLDNSDEKVLLYKNNDLIDSTEILSDSKNNDATWQFCGSNFILESQTKGGENKCSIIKQENKTNEDNSKKTESPKNVLTTSEDNFANSPTTNTILSEKESEMRVIKLTKDIKTNQIEEDKISKDKYSIYGLIFFCLLLFVLFMIKNTRFNKNEFG